MSLTSMPRPLKFNSLNEFVLSSSHNFQQPHKPQSPKHGVYVIRNEESLFDRYNVNNLQLAKVGKGHLQVLGRNVVLGEEDIGVGGLMNTQGRGIGGRQMMAQTMQVMASNPKQNNFMMQTNMTSGTFQDAMSPQRKPFAQTSQGFYIPPSNNQKPSKQYSQNQLLFNFNKMAEQKKAKKKQFLQTIEAKLNMIEQQAKELQQCHFEQELNLDQIVNIKNQMGRELTTNAFNGRITQKVYQNHQDHEQEGEEEQQKPKSLHIGMSPVEINHVLGTHFDENQKLLDEIIRVKSKSREKTSGNNTSSQWNQSPGKSKAFERTGGTQQGFNKTSISQSKKSSMYQENQKKIISATMRLPPKQGKR